MIKKKYLSRLLAIATAMTLTIIMSVPVFAAEYNSISYRPMRSASYSYNWLNVTRASTSTPAKGKNMSLWNTTYPGIDQFFNEVYKTVGGRSSYVICLNADPSLALNRSTSGGRAIMWTWNSVADFQDSALTPVSRYDSPQYYLSYGSYAGQYLTYASDTSGSAVSFGGSGGTVWDN